MSTQSIFTNQINNFPAVTQSTVESEKVKVVGKMNAYDTTMNNNLDNLKGIAGAQNTAYTIVTNESTRLMAKEMNIDQALDGQNRMITLNDSYVKKYSKYNQIIMIIVLIILIILGTNLLRTYLPIVPSAIFDLITVLVVGVGAISIFNLYVTIQRRDALYFDKLSLRAPTAQDISNISLDASASVDSSWNLALPGACIGSGCCQAPAQFISSIGKCVSPPTDIYDYTTLKFKTSAATTDTADQQERKRWAWDPDNNRWTNLGIGANGVFWNTKTTKPEDITALKDAPTLQAFTNMSNNISTLDKFETGYNFYK